jgi:hypothetical protein
MQDLRRDWAADGVGELEASIVTGRVQRRKGFCRLNKTQGVIDYRHMRKGLRIVPAMLISGRIELFRK